MKHLNKEKISLYFLTIMACLIACLFVVQKIVKADDLIPSDYRQIVFDQESGLGSSEVNCVFQSKSGYIWIGTEGGLYRYDGSSFSLYHLWDTEKEDVYSINSIYQDKEGRLWISTKNFGLFYIHGSSVEHFTQDYYSGVKNINSVVEDASGDIYVATAYGVYLADASSLTLTRIEALASHNIRGLAATADKVWGIYSGNHIFTIDEKQNVINSPADQLTQSEFSCISADENGKVYIGTNGNDILEMTNFYDTDIIHSPFAGIVQIYHHDDRMFVLSENGLGYFTASDEFNKIDELNVENYLSSMIIDYEGNFWISSSRMGVLFLGNSKFSHFNTKYQIVGGLTNCVEFFGNETWIGTDSGLQILDEKNHIVENELTKKLNGVSVRDFEEDAEGNIWIGTYRRFGIIEYKKDGEIVAITEQEGLISNFVHTIEILQDGTIAAGTDEGISIFNPDGTLARTYSYQNGMEYPSILAIYQDEDGRIFAGSDGGGIYILNGDEITNITDVDGLSSNVVSCFYKGNNGLFIGTDNGLSYYDAAFRTISLIDFSNNIYNIIGDGDVLHIIGSKGLISVSESQLLGTAELKTRYYSSGDGLDQTITIHSHSNMNEKGVLYICTDNGILTFDSKNIKTNELAPSLTISSVNVDGKIYYFDQFEEKLEVPKSTQRIEINIAALSFVNRENMKVRYKMNGFDDQTQELTGTDKLSAVYTNLDGGTYTFTVSAVNGDGVEREENISFVIEKKKGFLEYTLVRIVILSLVFGILILLLIFAIRSEKRFVGKNQELESLAKEHEDAIKSNTARTDYLANMSNSIKLPVNAMIRTAQEILLEGGGDEKQNARLKDIVEKGHGVMNQIDETIQLARLESGAVEKIEEPYSNSTLICDISDRMLRLLEDKPIKFFVDLGEKIPDVLIGDYDKIKQILEIILDNSIAYTKEGSITLTVDCFDMASSKGKKKNLVFTISDTGIGIARDRLNHIFEIYHQDDEAKSAGKPDTGIHLVIASRLTEIIGGNLEVESTFGSGSTFTLSLEMTIPDNEVHPTPVTESSVARVSPEEAERMWAPEVRALVVDDDELSRKLSLSTIKEMECKCDTASSGVSAIDMIMSHNYDIVLMDVAMPVMNGIDTLAEIRSLSGDEYQKLPVVALTEDVIGKNKSELTKAGFSDVILKPFDLAQFAGLLSRFVAAEKIKEKTMDATQYMNQSRFAEGLNALAENFDVSGTIERIGGNINVYNRILSSFYLQNKDAEMDLRNKFNRNFRLFRNKLHNIRTGCQNIGDLELADLAIRMENAINLGNKNYVRDNLDQMLSMLAEDIQVIEIYLQFVETEKDTDADMRGNKVQDDSLGVSEAVAETDNAKDQSPVSDSVFDQLEETEDTSTSANAATAGEASISASSKEASSDASEAEEVKEAGAEEDSKQNVIDVRQLIRMKQCLQEKNLVKTAEIFNEIAINEYVTEDMEFLSVLRKAISSGNFGDIEDLITTYLDLKSV